MNRIRQLRNAAPETQAASVILIALVLRFVCASALGLGIDETYTAATSRTLQWSLFDHPPFGWTLAHIGGFLFGFDNDLGMRTPFLLLFAGTSWLLFDLTRLLYGAKAGLWATVALSVCPVLGFADGSWILPDGPLIFALMAGALCLAHVFFEENPSPLWWLGAGLCAGLALLSKYHGFFLLFGAGLFMLTTPKARLWLMTPWPWLAGALAIAMFTPVILWNSEHHWVSFLFQGGRATAPRLNLIAPFALIAGQAVWLAPWLFIPLVLLLGYGLRIGRAAPKDWLLICLAIGPIVVFTLTAFWSQKRMLPHWVAPGYLMLFPLLGRAIAERIDQRATRMMAYGAASIILILAALIVVSHWMPIPGLYGPKSVLIEARDWRDLAAPLKQRGLLDAPNQFIATPRWQDAGKIDYALGSVGTISGAETVVCLSTDPRSYGVLHPAEHFHGRDALIIAPNLSPEQAKALYGGAFESLETLEPIVLSDFGVTTIELNLYRGRRFMDTQGTFNMRDRF